LPHEVLTKKARRWKVQFESLAVADCPCTDSLPELMETERKRINGQLYADTRYFVLCPEQLFFRSNHSLTRKCCLSMQYIERAITTVMRFMFPANLYLSFSILVTIALENVPGIGGTLGFVLSTGFLFLVVLQVFLGLGAYHAKSVSMVYYASSLLFIILMVVFVSLSGYLASKGGLSDEVFFAGLAGGGIYLLCAILMMQPVSIVFSTIAAIMMAPIITVMMPLYAVAKLSLTAADTVRQERLAFELARPEQQLALRRESMKAAVERHLATGEGGVDIAKSIAEIKQHHGDDGPETQSGSISDSGSQNASGDKTGQARRSNTQTDLEVADVTDDSKSVAGPGRRASMESATGSDAVAMAEPHYHQRETAEGNSRGSHKSAHGDAKVAPAEAPSTRRRRGSFSSRVSGASKAPSVAASTAGGMTRVHTANGKLRSKALGRHATTANIGDKSVAQAEGGDKKKPKLTIKNNQG